jgi:hypothetical protein
MTASSFPVRLIGAAVLSCVVSAAHATFTFSTLSGAGNAVTFAASVSGGIDNYSNLAINTDLSATSLTRTTVGASAIGYTVSTQADLQTVQASDGIGSALTVASNTDTLKFGSFTSDVRAFGINFYLTDLTPSAVGGGLMTVQATDALGATQSYSFTQSAFDNRNAQYLPLLVTLFSSAPLLSVELVPPSVGSNPNVFATADNLVLAVPEESTWLMMLAGGAFVLRRVARRRG